MDNVQKTAHENANLAEDSKTRLRRLKEQHKLEVGMSLLDDINNVD